MPASSPRPHLIRPRISHRPELLLGPGKADLIQAIVEHGSISAAGRSLCMGYRRAWSLLNEMQEAFQKPMIETAAGGLGGGGARVTEFGLLVLSCYRDIERACDAAAVAPLARLNRLMKR